MKGKKTGGRVANTPNKATADFKKLALEKYPNFNPIISLLDIYHDDSIDFKYRMEALKEVSKKYVPDLKAIEHSATDGSAILAPVILRPTDIKPEL